MSVALNGMKGAALTLAPSGAARVGGKGSTLKKEEL